MTMKNKKTFQYYLSKYLTEEMSTNRNCSANTIASYADTYKLFLSFMKDVRKTDPNKVSLNDLTRENVNCFLNWMENERKTSITSRHVRLSAMHSFVKYLQVVDPEHIFEYQKILSIKKKKACSKEVQWLTIEQLKTLLSCIDTDTGDGLRDKTMISLLYDAALRVEELMSLKVEDIHFPSCNTVTVLGKGNKKRTIPLMGNTVELLKKYVKVFDINRKRNHGFETLFFNRSGNKLTRTGVSYIISKYVKKANGCGANITIDVHPHAFRHTKAVHLLEAGVELIYIRDFLGHSSVKTTEIYARVCNKNKVEALEKAYVNIIDKDTKDWTKDDNLMAFLTELSRKK